MDLYLTRLLCAASLLLALGAIAARVAWRTRGAAAAHEVLRLAFAGVALCALLPAAPAPLPPVATPQAPVATPPAASRTTPAPALAPAPPPAATAPTDPPAAPAPTLPTLRATLLGLWALGAVVGLVQLLRGHLLLIRLRRESRPVQVAPPVPAPVRESDRLDAPLLAGCLRPVLYLPAAGPVRDEPDALAAALAHESAHLTRRDLPWILLACLVRALLWFHPLVHLAHRLLHQSAEEACDEAAVAATRDRRAYADLLLRLSAHTPAPVPSAGMATFRTRTGQRIAALLSDRLSRPLSLRGRLALRIGTAALLVVGTSLLGRQPIAAQTTPAPVALAGMAPAQDAEKPVSARPSDTPVTPSTKPMPIADAVAALCAQAGVADYAIAPGIAGTVRGRSTPTSLGDALETICLQTTPVSFPVWEGATLKIVAAPAPGASDSVHRLYRLRAVAEPVVFQEASGGGESASMLRGRLAIAYFHARGGEPLQVRVADDDRDGAPVAGAVVWVEARGTLKRLATNARGSATLTLGPGRHYVVFPPDARGATRTVSSGEESGRFDVSFRLRRSAPRPPDPKWQRRVSLHAVAMPFQDAVREVCRQIGVTRIEFPKGMNPKVTMHLENVPAFEALLRLSGAPHPGMFPVLGEPLRFRW